jgi:hypothetical protein
LWVRGPGQQPWRLVRTGSKADIDAAQDELMLVGFQNFYETTSDVNPNTGRSVNAAALFDGWVRLRGHGWQKVISEQAESNAWSNLDDYIAAFDGSDKILDSAVLPAGSPRPAEKTAKVHQPPDELSLFDGEGRRS